MTRLKRALVIASAAGTVLACARGAAAQTLPATPPDTAQPTAAVDGLTADGPSPSETATAQPPEPPPSATISDAIAGGKLLLEVRSRYEFVDQKKTAVLTQNGEAFTVRTRLGWETADWNGFRGLLEFEDVRQAGPEHFAVNVPGAVTPPLNGADKAKYPVINDPDVTELNRLQVTWTPNAMLQATVGRQRITLDDQRFIGNVGWRQDEQTFDAVRTDVAYGRFKLFYAYVHHVNRILGEQRDWD
ncbi:MAG TPA: alginate export family protein, partial [Phenylobacterium sp.]